MKIYLKIFVITLFLCVSFANAFAQDAFHNENSQWVFANNIRFDFRSGSLVVDSSACYSSSPFGLWGAATICDKQGNLLFYINQLLPNLCLWSADLYNSSDQEVENGDSLFLNQPAME